jgi:monooxygenase
MSDFDVLIVGAGISGICAAYHLQTACPDKTYALLEARERLGGTWDLFQYPGIRSDSDMHTLGFPFRPWVKPKAIADGPSILAYLRETAEAFGIDRKIRYGKRVKRARWSSATARWQVEVEDAHSGEVSHFTCAFLLMCAGYYDYEQGYTPEFEGTERFRGRIVHPQHWPTDLDYEGKRVVVIGSGATAVTLVPELAKRAAHVVMLQRSPTYIVSVPARDPVADWLRTRFSPERAYKLVRAKNVLVSMGLYAYCRAFPEQAKRRIIEQVERQVGPDVDVHTHFTPHYKPWDQRMCLVPDGDLFKALRRGRASIVTDHIERFTEQGLLLKSGAELEADIIVTATGLKLKFLGGVSLEVDGAPVNLPDQTVYRGMMCSDVPNLAFLLGYTNASWTLRCNLTAAFVCRLLKHMDQHGYARCTPRLDPTIPREPLLSLTSGYVQRALGEMPRQGAVSPWRVRQNYLHDRVSLRLARFDDGALEFAPRPGAAQA